MCSGRPNRSYRNTEPVRFGIFLKYRIYSGTVLRKHFLGNFFKSFFCRFETPCKHCIMMKQTFFIFHILRGSFRYCSVNITKVSVFTRFGEPLVHTHRPCSEKNQVDLDFLKLVVFLWQNLTSLSQQISYSSSLLRKSCIVLFEFLSVLLLQSSSSSISSQ